MTMIIWSNCDLNDTDSNDNTILHNVICDFLREIDFHHDYQGDNQKIQIDQFLEIVKMLLENGAHPHANNKEGKCPLDAITATKLRKFNTKDIMIHCKDLMTKYDCTLTLKYQTAKKIVGSNIPYRILLLESLGGDH